MTRLEKQLGFLLECDRMKSIYRQTYILADESRGVSMREFEGDSVKQNAPDSSSLSFVRNPQSTLMQGIPVFLAVCTSTSESPT